MVRKYGKSAQNEVKKEMHRFKRGTAHSGPKKKTVKSRKQAIAIGLSKARKKGAKAPKKASSATKSTGKRKASSAGRKKKTTSRSKK